MDYVKLGDSEIESVQRLGLPMEIVDCSARFLQSRLLLSGKGCASSQTWPSKIYLKCQCSLVNRYKAGELAFEEELRHINTAQTMAYKVQKEARLTVGGLLSKSFLDLFKATLGGDINSVLPLSHATKLDFFVLRMYFDNYFRKSKPLRVGV